MGGCDKVARRDEVPTPPRSGEGVNDSKLDALEYPPREVFFLLLSGSMDQPAAEIKLKFSKYSTVLFITWTKVRGRPGGARVGYDRSVRFERPRRHARGAVMLTHAIHRLLS